MTTPRYLPVATFKSWWKTETSTSDSLIEAAINAAELAIDNALQRRMIVSAAAATARVYAPSCSQLLAIHDCTSVTAVVENGVTLTANTDYQLEPLNGLSVAGESWPYFIIRRLGRNWYTDGGKSTVSVTAVWSWPAIPFQVVESCKIIAADMLSNRDMRNGLVAISEAGGVGSQENRTVTEMIDQYRHPSSWGLG